MADVLQAVRRLGQSVWYDYIRRSLLTSGELQRLVEMGVTGLTSNPTIFQQAVIGSADYDRALEDLVDQGQGVQGIYEALVVEDIRWAADLLRPVYDQSDGADGFVSIEVSPALAHDAEGTVAEARRLFSTLGRPNVMVKVPATPAGIPAIRSLIAHGVNVNATLLFSPAVYQQVQAAYVAGLEDMAQRGGDVSRVASVASFFVSRVDTAVDALLEERIRAGDQGLKPLLGKAAIANAKVAYQSFRETFGGKAFAALRARGARVQRPLWASTSTKNPAYSDVLYVEPLIGSDTVNTMPPATLTAFLEHGRAEATLERDMDGARQTLEALEAASISMEEVTSRLLADGVRAFAASFDGLLADIEQKRGKTLARAPASRTRDLGAHSSSVDGALEELDRHRAVERVWERDHTLWRPEPTEITDRLGWLSVTEMMRKETSALEAFARKVRDDGYRHVALLGMGGSSLGSEVLRQTLGSQAGYPELVVLDSTVPAWVGAVTTAVDLPRTLFVVSSKSGSTIEPLSFYWHFRALEEEAVGKDRAGEHFVAITDAGTALELLAAEQGFRRVFLNLPDVGGRYSVLSYFGLLPAALAGVDIGRLLERAERMRQQCLPGRPARENLGAWLGAVMGVLASQGQDKLTLITSPSLGSFGLWVEQLIAESTGKEGKGIIPVAGEPLVAPDCYGDDRLFVYLRLEEDDNTSTDRWVERVQSVGRPVVRLDTRDRYDLGAEFFRWEFATAVAGAVLGVHPFDQPDVQHSKDATARLLRDYIAGGRLPDATVTMGAGELLSRRRPSDYVAVTAYVRQTPEVDQALVELRRRVLERYGLATTVGYGPRYLHSTGQLHKGGPDRVLLLQVVGAHGQDIPIPGQPYTFGVLADAQALGDLRALQEQGRRVARVSVGEDIAGEIGRLAREITGA